MSQQSLKDAWYNSNFIEEVDDGAYITLTNESPKDILAFFEEQRTQELEELRKACEELQFRKNTTSSVLVNGYDNAIADFITLINNRI